MDYSDEIDYCSEWAVTYAKHTIVRQQYPKNRIPRGFWAAHIKDPPKEAEVAIDGALDLQDKDEPQPPRITRRLWAELEQPARERERNLLDIVAQFPKAIKAGQFEKQVSQVGTLGTQALALRGPHTAIRPG